MSVFLLTACGKKEKPVKTIIFTITFTTTMISALLTILNWAIPAFQLVARLLFCKCIYINIRPGYEYGWKSCMREK